MAKFVRKVIIWLYLNLLTPAANDRYGKVHSGGIVDNMEVSRRFKKEGSEYQTEAVNEILNRADRIRRECLTEGLTVHTGFVNARLGVQGSFTKKEFDPSQHKLVVKSTASAALRRDVNEVQVEVMGDAKTGIEIVTVIDSLTGDQNSTITPSDIITIEGDRLQVEGDQTDVGIYLIKVGDGTRNKVSRIISNKNKELIVMLPTLMPGDYQLEIISQSSSGGTLLKTPNKALFDDLLTVV